MTPHHGRTPAEKQAQQPTPQQRAPVQQPPTQQFPPQRDETQTGGMGQPLTAPQQPSTAQPSPPQQPSQQLGQPIAQQPPQQPAGQFQQAPAATGQMQPPQAGGTQLQQQVTPQQSIPQQAPPTQRQSVLKAVRVNEILTEDVVTVERDTPLQTVVSAMAEHNVGSVVVVEDDKPLGVITDRKIALALAETPDISQRIAEELLSGEIITADPSMNIFDALRLLSDEGIRRLPIIDDDGTLRGIITLDDALVLLGGMLGEVSETVESQSPR